MSAEYRGTDEHLDQWARRLSDALDRSARTRGNEMELREDVHAVITDAARELYGFESLWTTGERRAGQRGQRRYDRAYGGLVVEWEWNMDSARRRHGAEQALDYLERMRSEVGEDQAFSAVVCDGRHWGFLVVDAPRGQLTLEDVLPEPVPEAQFEWRPNSRAACRRFLSLIGTNSKQPVSAPALATSFGPGADPTRKAITLLVEALAGRSRDDRVDTLFGEWGRSLEVVYEDLADPDGELAGVLRKEYGLGGRRPLGELLFCVHTYFALVARLVAIEVLALSIHDQKAQPSLWSSLSDDELRERLEAIDAGQVPATLRVQNLFEGDLFSWYLDVLPGNSDLLDAVRSVLERIGQFAFPRLAFGATRATDVLRDLYQRLLPRKLRKALGEFLTPQWLAEACLERLRIVGAPLAYGRVLDPTCGTGTFLLPVLSSRAGALRVASRDLTEDDVQALLDDVVGFDLNPVAVIAARVNYVIALGDLASVGELTLPIWRADSILVPDSPTVVSELGAGRLAERPWLALRTSLPDPFPVPPPLAHAQEMPVLRRLLEAAVEEPDQQRALGDFEDGLGREFGANSYRPVAAAGREWDDVREVAVELYERIRRLKEAERNGVWARLIENSFAPLFAGRFDVVVGNPPWLGWGKMPESWRNAGMVHWKRYGLWRPPVEEGQQPRSQPQMGDVATLVYATAVDRYAKRGGYVGLLVPRNLVIGDPGGRAFRRFHLAASAADVAEVGYGPQVSFNPVYLDGWDRVKPFAPDAANAPVFLVSRTAEPAGFPVPTSRWKRVSRKPLGPAWPRTRGLLTELLGESAPVVQRVPTAQWRFRASGSVLIEGGSNDWPWGKGFDTRGANGVYFVEVRSTGLDNAGRVEVVNDPATGRNESVGRRSGRVEGAMVYPVVRGENVQRWRAESYGHVVAPYRQQAMGVVLPTAEFRHEFPETYRWLAGFRPVLEGRKIVNTLNWDMSGDDWAQIMGTSFMNGSPCVVVREQSARPAAAVVRQRWDDRLARTATVLIDHKLVFCAVQTEEEAHYLAAMVNSEPVQLLLQSFLNEVSVSPATLRRLPIPAYDAKAAAELVMAARQASSAATAEDGDALAAAEADVNRLVLEALLRAKNDAGSLA